MFGLPEKLWILHVNLKHTMHRKAQPSETLGIMFEPIVLESESYFYI